MHIISKNLEHPLTGKVLQAEALLLNDIMAPEKRKSGPTNDSFMRSKKTFDAEARPNKRVRQDDTESADQDQKKRPSTKGVNLVTISKVKDEEKAFPRGGASILTPLEHKQIQIDATRDVLFEQDVAKAKASSDEKLDARAGSAKSNKKVKGKVKAKKGGEAAADTEDTIKIEGLNYKRLHPGSLVLGVVSQINAHDIAVALPNNLTGYIPITSISDKVTQRIEKMAEEDSDGDVEDADDDVSLSDIFRVGQYLRAYVVSTTDTKDDKLGEKAKRRIELSVVPQQANSGITANELVPNSMIMAAVSSVEDHGLIMDIGFEESGIRGFMSSKDIGHNVNISKIQEGAVFLCAITGLNSNGKTVKLVADVQKIVGSKKQMYLAEAPTIDAFLPGTAVEVLVTDITHKGIAGKVMGSLDVTADLMHSGAGASGKDLEKKYKIGSKLKARVICTFPKSDPRKLGVSLLDHVMSLSTSQTLNAGQKEDPLQVLALSTIVDEVRVKQVEPGIGLFVDVGLRGVSGFVHISRVADGKIETLSETSGPYKLESKHRGRIIGYNAMDAVYLVSLEPKILEQAFLRIEDLKIGEIVQGKVEKLIVNADGVGGVLVNLADGISGLVPEMHLADVALVHPEKKFKEGTTVKARVLSTDPSRRQIRLTLKKTLVNSDIIPWSRYSDISPGMQSPGTIVNILAAGAVIQFYGSVRGFLPVSEMSEAYIADPSQHFRVGQVVHVHVLNVDADASKLTVSCKDPTAFGLAQQTAIKKLKLGDQISATITEKSNDLVSLELAGTGLKATLPVGHLTDGSDAKNANAAKKLRVGQTLQDLVVLDKNEEKHVIHLSNKPSLLQAAKSRTLLRSFEDVKENKIVHGFVKNITPTAVFVQFAGGLTGLLPKTKINEKAMQLPDFGMRRQESVTVKVISVDNSQQRFLLSQKDVTSSSTEPTQQEAAASPDGPGTAAVNPVDEDITSTADLSIGRLTSARIVSVKDTQINVQLADNIQGRIDVSQMFDSWEDIKDRKQPLKNFSAKQILKVRVLGIHDARNHRFLPISHRAGKTVVYELSAKPSDQNVEAKAPLTLQKIKVGSMHIGYVNNIGDDCLWINLSPNVRGRIKALDVSDDVTLLNDLENNFPVGSALKVRVSGVDVDSNRLDLSARTSDADKPLTFQSVTNDMVLPGKVTRVNERHIMVQLSENVSGPVNLTDLADDFSEANPSRYSKNDIVRVCVVEMDTPNKRVRLSTRPSRVLNSSLPVKDREITSISQLKVNDVVRGFVKHVADNGLFVNLGGNVTAYVRVSDLSDSFLAEWKGHFQVDQLVKGKITSIDEKLNHIQMSLKASVLDPNYVAPITFNDLTVGQVVTGKIRRVQDFGAFIVIDGSNNLSGLCHKSEMTEKRVDDATKLFEEGDAVKAIVLKLDADSKRISLGLKPSYFEEDEADSDADEDEDDDDDGLNGAKLDMDVDSDDEDAGDLDLMALTADAADSSDEGEDEGPDEEMQDAPTAKPVVGLSGGGFDWDANILDEPIAGNDDSTDEEATVTKKKKNRKSEIKIDRTGLLDANEPQTSSDFERLLLGQPNSSELWIKYMAFYMQLSELAKAREVAERAIKTINVRDETEKLNIWIALLNLENAFGSNDTVQETFQRACQYNDAQEVHERLVSIYIQSGKHSVSPPTTNLQYQKANNYSRTQTISSNP